MFFVISIGYGFKIPIHSRSFKRKECPPKVDGSTKILKKNKRLYIVTLGCLVTYRKRGIGTKMMKEVLDKVSHCNNKITSIFLHVQTNNEDAIKFYKNFGFEIAGEVPDYYRSLTPSNAYVLEKILD